MRETLTAVCAMLIPVICQAEPAQAIGDWVIVSTDAAKMASTSSDSGGTLGFICINESSDCQYLIQPGLECQENAIIPLLATGEAGSVHLTGTCIKFGSSKILALSESLDQLIAGSGYIGVAVAMADGRFKVLRFSLNGAIQTIAMIKSPKKEQAPVAPKKMSDSFL